MEYKQDVFYRTPQQNMSKIPFYMAYPMQTIYMEELEYARDLDKLKGMYPKEVRAIQEMVEDECDKMEYEGSLMFDEYPDRLMLEMLVDKILQKVEDTQPDVTAEQYRGPRPPGPPGPGQRPPQGPPPGPGPRPPHRPENHLRELIGVILNNEMYRRRCRHRRCRRWW